MKTLLVTLLLSFQLTACSQSIDKEVGGSCEGCEAIYEYSNQNLNAVDTIPGFDEYSQQLILKGTIYEKDGETPASNVILYVYQTNPNGIYEPSDNASGWERRHGQHRGWIKTGENGIYTFYSFRPASYPNTKVAQHIHATVKPPGYSEYYIDSFHFSDDPNLTPAITQNMKNRGGSGIIELKKKQGMLFAERDIILGKNIPGY